MGTDCLGINVVGQKEYMKNYFDWDLNLRMFIYSCKFLVQNTTENLSPSGIGYVTFLKKTSKKDGNR